MLELWELCEHAQCTRYMILRYIPYFYCFSEHFASIPFYFVVHSIYMRVCTIVSYPFASVTYRDNRNLILYLVLITRIIKACWFDFNRRIMAPCTGRPRSLQYLVDVAGVVLWGGAFVFILLGRTRCPSGAFSGWYVFFPLFSVSLIGGGCDADGFPCLCMDRGAMHTTSPQPLRVFYASLWGLVCFLMWRIYMLVRFRRGLDNDNAFIDLISLCLAPHPLPYCALHMLSHFIQCAHHMSHLVFVNNFSWFMYGDFGDLSEKLKIMCCVNWMKQDDSMIECLYFFSSFALQSPTANWLLVLQTPGILHD